MTDTVLVTDVQINVVSVSEPAEIIKVVEPTVQVVHVIEKGPKGDPGEAGFVSSDPNNRLSLGGDGGLYSPDIQVDPLAYYILAKA